MQPTLDEVRKRFQNDRFATLSGARIEKISRNSAVCSMKIGKSLLNAAGTVMGGAIFTLADFTFAVAANWNKPLHVSVSSQITFLAPPKGSALIAKASVIKEGRSTCLYEIDIRDDAGTKVAFVTVNGFIKREKN